MVQAEGAVREGAAGLAGLERVLDGSEFDGRGSESKGGEDDGDTFAAHDDLIREHAAGALDAEGVLRTPTSTMAAQAGTGDERSC